MATIFERGWVPRYHVLDFVRWRRRCWNSTADKIGRCALAQSHPIRCFRTNFKKLISTTKWIQIHTDGGVDDSGASAAFTVTVWFPNGDSVSRQIVSVSADLLEPGVTPLFAEACALLSALRFIRQVVCLSEA